MGNMFRSTIAFLCTVVIHGNVIYQPGRFPFSKCTQGSNYDVSCERINMRTEHEGFPSVLPPGPYAVLMSKFGCPESNARGWRRGVIKFEASSIETDKEYTFCVKLRTDPELDTGRWIPGAYTVFKTGETCPEEFSESTQAWNHSGTVSVFGHVPNFTILNTTANSSILFDVCEHESTYNINETDYDPMMTSLVLGKNQESDCPNLNRTFELNVLEEGGHVFCFYMFAHEKLQDINVAVGKPAHVSSKYSFHGNSATLTVDGNLEQFRFCIFTPHMRDNWWHVDLQNMYKIGRIKIFNRIYSSTSFWNGMLVLVGNTLSNLFKVSKLKRLGYRTNIDMPRNTVGRYVELRVKEKRYFYLCEVEVYATLAYKVDTVTQLMSSFTFFTGTLKVSEKISWFYTGNGTLQTSVMKAHPYTWYHIDLHRTLSVFEIEVKINVLVKRRLFYKEMYIGCIYGDAMFGFLHHESKGCNDEVYFRSGVLRIFPRMVRARYVTLLFDEEGQIQRIRGKESLKIHLSDFPSVETCNEDLGMTDESIHDLQITASSWLSEYPPWNAKPLKNGWCAEKTDFQPWIMVDLLAVTAVEGVRIWSFNANMVESDHEASKGFLLFFGTNIKALTEYRDTRFNIDMSGNWTDVQTFILLNPIETRYVKLEISDISDVHICLKFELLGCQVSGIPSLDCKTASELFDFDTLIITERKRVVQNEENTVNACKRSCLQDTNCSIAKYNDNCAHYLPSQFAMWQLNTQKTERKFAKICTNDSIILFPTLVSPEGNIFTHMEMVVEEAVITSIGYPFSYKQGQIYKWLIQFSGGRYIKFVFTNVSLGKEQECYTKLLISKKMKDETAGKYIDHRYQDRVFVIETGESQLFLTFNSCPIHERDTNRGFRAVIKGEGIKSCLSVDSDNVWRNGRHEVCTEPEMILTSMTFLNLPFEDVDETWKIYAIEQHTVQLHILDFYIVCPRGYSQRENSSEKHSKFAVDIANEEKIFCNTNLPPDLINTDTSNVVVKFRKHVDPTKTYFRTEGFRLRYLSVKYSLAEQGDTSSSESTVCSSEFRKCYHIVSSIRTWSRASDVCFHRYQTLVKVESENEMNFINYILREATYRYNFERREEFMYDTSLLAHIGLRRSSNELGQDLYLWEDHSAVTYSGWRVHNPVYHMYCTRTNFGFYSHKTWESEHCTKDIAQFFVCQSSIENEKTKEYNEKLLTCRDGWRRYKDSCYYFSDDFGHKPDIRDNASKICENLGAYLAEIEDVEENNFLGTIVLEKKLTSFWIGIEHLVNKGKTVWSSSGKELTFTNWRSESESKMDNEEYCGVLYVDKTWLARDCLIYDYDFICEKNSERTTRVCGDGFSDRSRSVRTTYTGNDCQNWDDLTTAADNDFKARYPSLSTPVNASNYCLDPSSSGILWCYTTNSDLYVWEPCFISPPDVEEASNRKTTNETFKCKDGSAISILSRCDGVFHCQDQSDETFCTIRGQVLTNNGRYNFSKDSNERLEIGPYFHCGSKEWISILSLCDDIIDCLDASDESDCFEDSGEASGSCSDYGTCAQNDGLCDFSLVSTDGEREFREFTQCDPRYYTCNNGQCISVDKRCDALKDCADGSDENQCGFCNGAFHCDDVKCIPQRLICDMYPDCEDGSDEATCFQESPSSCDQWWEQGYHDSGEYLIEGFKVTCNFTMKNSTAGEISMTIKDIDVEVIKQTGYFFTEPLPGYNEKYEESNIQTLINRHGYVCSVEIYTLCKWNAIASTITSLYNEGYFHYCTCKVDSFETNKDRKKIWRKVETNNKKSSVFNSPQCYGERSQGSNISRTWHYNFTQDGHLSFEDYVLKGRFPAQIKHGSITCDYDYVGDATSNVFVCKDDARTIPKWIECIYDVDTSGYIKGCRSGGHLKNCSNFSCPEKTVKCPNSYCIPLHFVCDRKVDCPGGQDEFECTCSNTNIEVVILVEDALTVTEISSAAQMLAEQFYNDEESRVRLMYFTTQTPLSEYNIEHRLLDIREGFYQTISRRVECSSKYMARNLLGSMKFKANTTKSIIFLQESVESAKVAEIMFANLSIPDFEIYRVLKSVEFNKTDTYRFVKDIYVNKWSELYTLGYRRFPKICEAVTDVPCSGGYRCSSSKQCLPLDQVCDGITQCNGKDDEQLCDFFCPKTCKCVGYSVDCQGVDMKVNEAVALSYKTRRADFSKNPDLHNTLRTSNFYYPNMIRLNLSACEITNMTGNGFSYLSNLVCLDVGYNRIKILQNNTFNNLRNLVYLNLDGNFELQVISTTAFHGLVSIKSLRITGSSLKKILMHTFYGLTLQTIDISYNQIKEIEDYAFSNSSVEKIDMRGNDIVIFNERIFNGVESLKELVTPAFKFCCIRPCYVEEAACVPKKNEFSSCGDLMRHPILQAVLWLVGIAALFGNLGSVIYRLVYDRERLQLGYGIFVTNLALADFMMGVYLIIIAVTDTLYRNRYIFLDDQWRNSIWCVAAGVLSTVSSEASVLFLCLITLDRLLVIKYPIGTIRFRQKEAHIACLISWIIALILALIPLVHTSHFQGKFYSRSGVCVALPLTRDKPPGWMYSVCIFVGLNFCTFMLVAAGQISIFRALKKANLKKTLMSRKNDLQVARNLILVATTDFLCWFPVGIMGIMALNGYPIPGDIYAWTVVFIIPLNSALNPMLYTLTAILGKQSFNPSTDEQNRTELAYMTGSLIVRYQNLLHCVRIKSDVAQPGKTIRDLYEEGECLSVVSVVAIAWRLSKLLSLLHESCVSIKRLTADNIYVKFHKQKLGVSIVIDSKLTVSSDKKALRENIRQFGGILQLLESLTRKR